MTAPQEATHETVVLTCPVDDCVWTHTETMPVIPEGVLAGIFGPGVMTVHARNVLRQRLEDALQAHHTTHEVADYLSTITRLRSEVAWLRGDAL